MNNIFKCRHSVKENNKDNLVWFGSYGRGEEVVGKSAVSLKDYSTTITLSSEIVTMKGQKYKIVCSCTSSVEIKLKDNNQSIINIIKLTSGNDIIYEGILNGSVKYIEITGASNFIQSKPLYIYFYSYYRSKIWNSNPTDTEKITASYSEGSKAIADDLLQRLSILQGELFYKPRYGLPLINKEKNKIMYDACIANVINDLSLYIQEITSFKSRLIDETNKKYYKFDFSIKTIYGEEERINN